MSNATKTNEAAKLFDAIFGEGSHAAMRDEAPARGIRLKIQPSGRLTVAHPKADGPCIIKVQQVPATVSAAEVLCRMESVCVLRKNKTLHFGEIRKGAIIR